MNEEDLFQVFHFEYESIGDYLKATEYLGGNKALELRTLIMRACFSLK